jgi:hypothetical protein
MSTGRTYIDDNFGTYDIESEEDVEFYFETQRASVRKKCRGCGRMVKIKPEYAYCNGCATKREQGGDF